ncbi:hypothetical protein V8E55_009105 [Tylopilus felleus]
MTLSLFLDVLSWGDESCTANDHVRYARAGLLVSEELPNILARWYKPPRNKNKGPRPAGACQAMQTFAIDCVLQLLEREMECAAPLFASPPSELSETHLTSFDFQAFTSTLKTRCPTAWRVIEQMSYSNNQRSRNTHKSPDMVILHQLSQAQYTRSHHRNRVAKLWAIYLKACGLSARAFDALHALGLVMSHKWTVNAYGTLSQSAMDSVRQEIQHLPWIISHDNVNIPMRVFSQRLHNQSHFISGCAATVWLLPPDATLPLGINCTFHAHRAEGCHKPFPLEDLLFGDQAAHLRTKSQYIYHVLQILLNTPDFADYKSRDHASFQPPPTVNILPCSPNDIVKQCILHTVDIEEASYEGNDRVMAEFYRQLGINSKEEVKKTGLERLIGWVGDQLTVEWLRGLFRYRHEDYNSFDHMDYLIPIFGWFHLIMAFANSLHKQYLGLSSITGSLQHAFDILQRKGLQKSETKGPFWHHLDEALHHIAEAHICATWLVVANKQSFADLATKSPGKLHSLAVRLIDQQASRCGLAKLQHLPEEEQDAVLSQWTMFNNDMLSYIELSTAIKCGDVGRMEDMLPTLLFRFAGGENSKYTIEVLELLQGLKQEWPQDVKNYVHKYCWLMNRSGKPSGWTPIDQGQEQNIGDIKVTYHSFWPGATWNYLHKVSPAIPTLHSLQCYMESEFKTVTCGAHHGIPSREVDITKLTEQYIKSNIHVYTTGRKLRGGPKNEAKDFVTNGAVDLEWLGTFENWWKNRAYERSTAEEWNVSTTNM